MLTKVSNNMEIEGERERVLKTRNYLSIVNVRKISRNGCFLFVEEITSVSEMFKTWAMIWNGWENTQIAADVPKIEA